jgi:hypothetical protein
VIVELLIQFEVEPGLGEKSNQRSTMTFIKCFRFKT